MTLTVQQRHIDRNVPVHDPIAAKYETLFADDYLLLRSGYRDEVYREYLGRCTDMRVTALRKRD